MARHRAECVFLFAGLLLALRLQRAVLGAFDLERVPSFSHMPSRLAMFLAGLGQGGLADGENVLLASQPIPVAPGLAAVLSYLEVEAATIDQLVARLTAGKRGRTYLVP